MVVRGCLDHEIQYCQKEEAMDDPLEKDTGIHAGYKIITDDINFQRCIHGPFYSLPITNRSENGSS